MIKETSKIEVDFYDPWSRTGFKALRERADAAGRVIMAQFGSYLKGTFDKDSFMESAKEFVKIFPVDGFSVGFSAEPGKSQVVKELVAAIKELNLRVSLWFKTSNWQELKQTGLGKMVDNVVVIPWPSDKNESIENFNTDRFAEDMIKDVVKAGVDLNKLFFFIVFFGLTFCIVGAFAETDLIATVWREIQCCFLDTTNR
ncbi:hypothetical protein Pmar_PMAR022208 [Perkinsus marinus ATCC 50983]|uniref:GP-PDE domain-containing protein n=1 Tax=Perkinsus marinus (strain ATCC 50983 / TXsc) TaxID=423536 RepID=C5LKE9_PERM5|nr:hypothetical protein Pmar_PMAR022208 [Perkinsus marinus ATCC 50983]EER02783.1 hypothetical protein Pmar_PMAR022208 [Perkinsus marinus ATCC 50983]|eukprot:XP_002770967.1 hypothetical protein Pmar_PMAR022208 [Perkinsus marinus ATCC 50983]